MKKTAGHSFITIISLSLSMKLRDIRKVVLVGGVEAIFVADLLCTEIRSYLREPIRLPPLSPKARYVMLLVTRTESIIDRG
jgi:hypothetical protein